MVVAVFTVFICEGGMMYVTLVNDALTHSASSPNWKSASKEKDRLCMINTSPAAQLE